MQEDDNYNSQEHIKIEENSIEQDHQELNLEKKSFFAGVRTTLAFQLAGYRTTLQYQDQMEAKRGQKEPEKKKREPEPSSPPMPTDFGSWIAWKETGTTGTSTDLDKCILELSALQRGRDTPQDQLTEPDFGTTDLLEKIQRELLERVPYDERNNSGSAPVLDTDMSGDIDVLESIRRKLLTA